MRVFFFFSSLLNVYFPYITLFSWMLALCHSCWTWNFSLRIFLMSVTWMPPRWRFIADLLEKIYPSQLHLPSPQISSFYLDHLDLMKNFSLTVEVSHSQWQCLWNCLVSLSSWVHLHGQLLKSNPHSGSSFVWAAVLRCGNLRCSQGVGEPVCKSDAGKLWELQLPSLHLDLSGHKTLDKGMFTFSRLLECLEVEWATCCPAGEDLRHFGLT